ATDARIERILLRNGRVAGEVFPPIQRGVEVVVGSAGNASVALGVGDFQSWTNVQNRRGLLASAVENVAVVPDVSEDTRVQDRLVAQLEAGRDALRAQGS